MHIAPPTRVHTRSRFVTVLAWVFIVLGGGCVLVALLQALFVTLVFHQPEVQQALDRAQQSSRAGAANAREMMSLVIAMLVFVLAVCSGLLAAAIGLLKRKNWALKLFVGYLLVGAVMNAAVAALPIMLRMPDLTIRVSPQAFGAVQDLQSAVTFGFSVFAGAVAALLVYLFKRLRSASIRSEFARPPSNGRSPASNDAGDPSASLR
jgi:hypothetical protein